MSEFERDAEKLQAAVSARAGRPGYNVSAKSTDPGYFDFGDDVREIADKVCGNVDLAIATGLVPPPLALAVKALCAVRKLIP